MSCSRPWKTAPGSPGRRDGSRRIVSSTGKRRPVRSTAASSSRLPAMVERPVVAHPLQPGPVALAELLRDEQLGGLPAQRPPRCVQPSRSCASWFQPTTTPWASMATWASTRLSRTVLAGRGEHSARGPARECRAGTGLRRARGLRRGAAARAEPVSRRPPRGPCTNRRGVEQRLAPLPGRRIVSWSRCSAPVLSVRVRNRVARAPPGREGPGRRLPGPVAHGRAGGVHPAPRSPGRAGPGPVPRPAARWSENASWTSAQGIGSSGWDEVGADARRRLASSSVRHQPSGGVVVVGAGVDDAVLAVALGQVGVVGVAVEGELQHLHPGQAELARAARRPRG